MDHTHRVGIDPPTPEDQDQKTLNMRNNDERNQPLQLSAENTNGSFKWEVRNQSVYFREDGTIYRGDAKIRQSMDDVPEVATITDQGGELLVVITVIGAPGTDGYLINMTIIRAGDYPVHSVMIAGNWSVVSTVNSALKRYYSV